MTKVDSEKVLKKIILDTKLYIETCLKIVNKAGELVSFKLNNAQIIVDGIIKDLEAKKKPIRIIILKARQMGLSTYTEGYIFKKTATQKFKRSKIIAHEDVASHNLYNMYKLFYENIPDILRPMKKYANGQELVFENPTTDEGEKAANPGLQSRVSVATAKNTKTGRSEMIHYLHASEVAFWDDAKTLMTGLMQTIPRLPNTAVIVESTANGIGGYFYDLWKAAERGENEFTPIFLPWFIDVEYQEEFDSEEEKKAFADEVNHVTYDKNNAPVYTYEKWLIGYAKEKYSIDLSYEQLKWRRWCIANNLNGDEEMFQQEYPSTPDEAFIASGRPKFSVSALKKYLTGVKEGVRGYLERKGKTVRFIEDPKGYIEIFKQPESGKFYCIGADVAEGLVTGDYSAAQVGADDFDITAVWHGHIDPDLFGKELVKLAIFYNDAYIGVERNNHGLTTLKSIENEGYYNIYYQKVYDKITDVITQKIGWGTDARTKPLMIDKLAEFVREMWIGIKDRQTIEELFKYVIEDNGSTNAQEGEHDDLVMSLAIWLQMVLEGKGDSFIPVKSDDSPMKKKPTDIDLFSHDDDEDYKQESMFGGDYTI